MISNNLISGAWFLDGDRSLQERITKTQKQISSGYRIQDAADSPKDTANVIGLGTSISSTQQYLATLGRVGAEASAVDTALSTGITLIDRARQLAVRAASSVTSAADRQNIAIEVVNLQQQIVGIANTTVEGRFVFGGDQDDAQPYQYDASSARGADRLTIQTTSRIIEDPHGLPVFAASSASAIFDAEDASGAPAATNIFAGLNSLVTALNSNDPTAVSGALSQLRAGSDWLNQKQAGYGASARRIADETTLANSFLTGLRSRLSELRDTAIVQAATDLSLQSTAQSAAFSAQASVPRKSLFDYIG